VIVGEGHIGEVAWVGTRFGTKSARLRVGVPAQAPVETVTAVDVVRRRRVCRVVADLALDESGSRRVRIHGLA